MWFHPLFLGSSCVTDCHTPRCTRNRFHPVRTIEDAAIVCCGRCHGNGNARIVLLRTALSIKSRLLLWLLLLLGLFFLDPSW